MSKVSAIAATVRTLAGVAGLGLGYFVTTGLLATLQLEVTAETWESLLATDSFGTIAALFVSVLSVGLGVLFAYIAETIRGHLFRRNIRCTGDAAAQTSLKL
ncbi:hypothetical protein [Cryobacterium sp. W22_MBD10_FK3]|uniref:hypothetical protein n=1 Tax=Cryobacterium sp. W22_MBD10_FK3 TaxID=3240273 RepID=UPI003F9051BC